MKNRGVGKFFYVWCMLHPIFLLSGAELSSVRLYGVPSAMVIYDISGGGILSDDVNLTIKGKGKLRFREWGGIELVEKQTEERTVGALHYKKERHTCEKRQERQILDVDFHTRKIRERPLPKGKKRRVITAGLEREGQQMIANVVCDMWRGRGVRRCIYKGIPLFTEYRTLGLYYREEAVDVKFDINTTDTSACSIPPYPVEKFALYTGSFKTKNRKTPTSFRERLVQSIEIFEKKGLDEEKFTPVQRQKLLNMLAEPIFEEQKQTLPRLLEALKRSRACLSGADDTSETNICLKDLMDTESLFADRRSSRIVDQDKDRRIVMEMIEEDIAALESKMKCIRAAKSFSDLAVCMKVRQ